VEAPAVPEQTAGSPDSSRAGSWKPQTVPEANSWKPQTVPGQTGGSPGLLVRGSGLLSPRKHPADELRALALVAAFEAVKTLRTGGVSTRKRKRRSINRGHPQICAANRTKKRFRRRVPGGQHNTRRHRPSLYTPKLRSAVQARSSSEACFAKQKRRTFSPRPAP
jgi:hypothetical protein